MNCPVCAKQLEAKPDCFMCPKQDGILLTGGHLAKQDIRLDEIAERAASEQAVRKDIIACPHCATTMIKVDYSGTGVIIDSCPKCAYRWLDAGELEKIKNFKPKIQPNDLLFMEGVDSKLQDDTKDSSTDPNTDLSNTVFDFMRDVSAGNESRTLGTLVGASFYGIVTGMIKSKFLRFAIPIFLIFVFLIYYWVIKSF